MDELSEELGGGLGVAVFGEEEGSDALVGGAVGEEEVSPGGADADVGFVDGPVVTDVKAGEEGEGEETEGSGFDVVEDGLVGDADAVEVEEGLLDLAKREGVVGEEVEAEGDDFEGVVDASEVDSGGFGGSDFAGGPIDVGFSEDVAEFELVRIKGALFALEAREAAELALAEGAVFVGALVEVEGFSLFDALEGSEAVGAAVAETLAFGVEMKGMFTDLAEELSSTAVVVVDVGGRGFAEGAFEVVGDG